MSEYLLLKQGDIYDGIKEEVYTADLLIEDGKIKKIAPVLEGNVINQAEVIDASGFRIYPGFVDAHCHLGIEGYATGYEGQEANELNDSMTPQLSAIDGINPQDVTFEMARKSGVTCVATGPGSSNVLGGTFCVIKTVGDCVDEMIVKEKAAMKCAFGENPKNSYRKKEICSRMTIASKLREILIRAKEYDENRYTADNQTGHGICVPYDEKLEALLPVIHKEIPLKAHVHRADDIFTAIRIAKEMNVNLTLEHCTDGLLIAKKLAKEGYLIAVGPSFGHATKPELKNKTFDIPAILTRAGCKVSIITDSPVVQEQYLPFCAGMAIKHGMKEFDALQAITLNPAKHVGVADRVGSLEEGKDADLVITQGSPFTLEADILYTIINGKIVYEKTKK